MDDREDSKVWSQRQEFKWGWMEELRFSRDTRADPTFFEYETPQHARQLASAFRLYGTTDGNTLNSERLGCRQSATGRVVRDGTNGCSQASSPRRGSYAASFFSIGFRISSLMDSTMDSRAACSATFAGCGESKATCRSSEPGNVFCVTALCQEHRTFPASLRAVKPNGRSEMSSYFAVDEQTLVHGSI